MADNYIVSARKYRPQTFDTVVGQEHITTTLKNAIKNNHLAHAYLFCGPRGVGKTSCARILAKTINCEHPTADMEACGVCATCDSFNNNTSFNVFELDAASNNSVDDIRELVNQVRFAPQAGKYKIYIIDEVHMLSASAFNAFLKTLEEPPSYAIFILATTEKHKILPTILSRCQIFDFKRIVSNDISNHLHSIATKERVVAQEAALHVIAQKSEGCMRDALSMFDRIVSFTNGMLTYNNTMEHLNLLDADFYFGLVDNMLAQDVSGALLKLDGALERGFEGDVILEGLAEHLRNLMLCKDPRMAKLLDVPGEHKAIFHEKANQAPPSFIISALNVVSDAEINYRNANNKRLHVEMCLIRLCYLLQAIEAGGEKKNTDSVTEDTFTPKMAAPVAAKASPEPAPEAAKARPASAPVVQPLAAMPVVEEPVPAPMPTSVTEAPKPTSIPLPVSKPAGNTPVRRISRGLIDGLDDVLASATTLVEEKKELTAGQVDHLYDLYKQKIQADGKMMVYAQLLAMGVELHPDNEVRLVCPTILADTYARAQQNDILDFYRAETGILVRVTTEIRLNEELEAQQQTKVLSKPEIFDEMARRNPALAEMREKLGLQIDF